MQKYVIPKNSPDDIVLYSCEGCNAKFFSSLSCRDHEELEQRHEKYQDMYLQELKERNTRED